MDFDSNNVQIMSISNKRAREIRVALVTIAACMYVIALFKSTTYSASTMACLNQPNGIFNGGAIFMTAVTILFFYGSFFFTVIYHDLQKKTADVVKALMKIGVMQTMTL